MTRVVTTEVAHVVRRLSLGLDVEVAAILPVAGGVLEAPILLAVGTPVSVRVTPLAVFATALRARAHALVLAHTHLTDSPPSPADAAVTRRLMAAGVIVGLPVLGHLVVGPSCAWDCVTGETWVAA